MIKIIQSWYKSRLLKYGVLTTTYGDLKEKFLDSPESFTLTELGQMHYMGQELITITEVFKAALRVQQELDEELQDKNKPKKAEESRKDGGLYL